MDGNARSWKAAIAAIIGAGAIVGFSVWVGWKHTRERHGEFDWELFAIVLTGFGTTALAAVTGFLASETRQDVRASRATADTAVRQLQSTVRPLLIPASKDLIRKGDRCAAKVSFVNAAAGPAIIQLTPRYRIVRSRDAPEPAWNDGRRDIARALMTQAQDWLFIVELDWPPLAMYVEVIYTDMNGEQPQRTTAYVAVEQASGDPDLNHRGFKLERLVALDQNADIDGDPVLSGDGWNPDKPGFFEF